MRLYGTHVRQLCLSFLLNSGEADDAAQDVFVKTFTSLNKYRSNVSFHAWICRIASNHCIDLLRKKKRQKTDSLDQILEQRGEQAPDSVSQKDLSEDIRVERRQKTDMAVKVLSTLSQEQRRILVLREVEGLSYEKIAGELECSLDAVKARLRRARLELKEKARHFFREQSFIKRESDNESRTDQGKNIFVI